MIQLVFVSLASTQVLVHVSVSYKNQTKDMQGREKSVNRSGYGKKVTLIVRRLNSVTLNSMCVRAWYTSLLMFKDKNEKKKKKKKEKKKEEGKSKKKKEKSFYLSINFKRYQYRIIF